MKHLAFVALFYLSLFGVLYTGIMIPDLNWYIDLALVLIGLGFIFALCLVMAEETFIKKCKEFTQWNIPKKT